MRDEPNLAVMESDLKHLSGVVHSLIKTSKDQQDIVQDLLLTARLMQQSQKNTDAVISEELKPKVNAMWENRSQVKGGYLLLTAFGSLILGGASVLSIMKALHFI